MPVLALLFPVPIAVAATAVVHLCNNLFKLALVGRHANLAVVTKFGLTAALGAVIGSLVLLRLAAAPVLLRYELFGATREIASVQLAIGLLIMVFALLELSPRVARLAIPARYLPLGGLASGFFGGLSGNQGALRAAFLIRAGLDKNSFVGTSVVCSVIVDTLRITIYGLAFFGNTDWLSDPHLRQTVLVAIIAAFSGAFIGVRLLQKVTLRFVQLTVATLMLLIGAGLALGLV